MWKFKLLYFAVSNPQREMGASVTEEGVKQSLAEWAVYEKWFNETILREDRDSGSSAVMILPCGSADPKYRDDTNAYVSLLLVHRTEKFPLGLFAKK